MATQALLSAGAPGAPAGAVGLAAPLESRHSSPARKGQAGVWSRPTSAITVGAAGVDGSGVLAARWPHELPKPVAEVLHLAGAQHTAYPQELGLGPAWARVSLAAVPETLAHRGGLAGPPVWLRSLTGLPDHCPGCRVSGLQTAGRGPGRGLSGPKGPRAPERAVGQRTGQLQVHEADATQDDSQEPGHGTHTEQRESRTACRVGGGLGLRPAPKSARWGPCHLGAPDVA